MKAPFVFLSTERKIQAQNRHTTMEAIPKAKEGEAMADRLIISPWLSMWAPNILVGVFGIFLVLRIAKVRKK